MRPKALDLIKIANSPNNNIENNFVQNEDICSLGKRCVKEFIEIFAQIIPGYILFMSKN